MRPADDTALGNTPPGSSRPATTVSYRSRAGSSCRRKPSEFPGSIFVFVQTRTTAIPHYIGVAPPAGRRSILGDFQTAGGSVGCSMTWRLVSSTNPLIVRCSHSGTFCGRRYLQS